MEFVFPPLPSFKKEKGNYLGFNLARNLAIRFKLKLGG